MSLDTREPDPPKGGGGGGGGGDPPPPWYRPDAARLREALARHGAARQQVQTARPRLRIASRDGVLKEEASRSGSP